ncbi:hypothetical protein Tco_1220811 [Tanacetum coccineum]
MIAPGSSRYISNDMVHNHYLEEAKKKTQESGRNSEPSVMPSARSQVQSNISKTKNLGIITKSPRKWPASKVVVSYALSWKPCQGDSLNLPDHRIHKDGDGDASFQLKSDSLPHAHAQTTKTFYKHQDSRIMKAQELKTKTSAQTLIYKIFLQRYQVYQGRLLASFQDDAKYEHVGQDTRSQGGKDDQDGRIKI